MNNKMAIYKTVLLITPLMIMQGCAAPVIVAGLGAAGYGVSQSTSDSDASLAADQNLSCSDLRTEISALDKTILSNHAQQPNITMQQHPQLAGSQLLSQAGSQYASQAGTQLLSQAGSQYASQAGTQLLSQAGSQYASQAGTQPLNQASNQLTSQFVAQNTSPSTVDTPAEPLLASAHGLLSSLFPSGKVDGVAEAQARKDSLTALYGQKCSARSRADSMTLEVQKYLNQLGYPCGTADGIAGKKTYEAIRRYQTDQGLPVDGKVTSELLVLLKEEF